MYTNRYNIILSLGILMPLAGCDNQDNDATDLPGSSDRMESANTHNGDADDPAYDKTTLDQSESSKAIAITAEIRRAIVDNDDMSIRAQNSKIITDESGLVTLRGVVDSQVEKDAIDAIAKAVSGVTQVNNQLEVDAE